MDSTTFARLGRHPLGPLVDRSGVTFRVWIPRADSVFIVGSFNCWDESDAPLRNLGDGVWEVRVAEARPGDDYCFVVVDGDRREWRRDGFAVGVAARSGNSIVPPSLVSAASVEIAKNPNVYARHPHVGAQVTTVLEN